MSVDKNHFASLCLLCGTRNACRIEGMAGRYSILGKSRWWIVRICTAAFRQRRKQCTVVAMRVLHLAVISARAFVRDDIDAMCALIVSDLATAAWASWPKECSIPFATLSRASCVTLSLKNATFARRSPSMPE